MKSILKILLILPFLLCYISGFSQTIGAAYKDLDAMKGRELVVLLEPESDSENKVLNNYLKEAVKTHWNFTDRYIFMNKEEVSSLNSSESIVLMFTIYKVRDIANLLLSSSPLDMKVTLGLHLSESIKPRFPSIYTDLVHSEVKSDITINQKDIIYGVQRLNTRLKMYFDNVFLDHKEIKVSSANLADKILLIDESLVAGKLTKEEIANVYPYPFKIASNDLIIEKLNEKSEKHAYVGVRRYTEGRSYSFYVTVNNCADGKLISTARKHLQEDYKLNTKQLKEFVKYNEKYN